MTSSILARARVYAITASASALVLAACSDSDGTSLDTPPEHPADPGPDPTTAPPGSAGAPSAGGNTGSGGVSGEVPQGSGGVDGETDGSGGDAPDGSDDDPVELGPPGKPSRLMQERPLEPVAGGRWIYNPHRGGTNRYQGSGHTHAAPDHSNMDPRRQQERLRDLPGELKHHFVWMTAHLTVIPDPGVSGITHLYGVENYTKKLPSGGAPHVVALLPDAKLVGRSQPFGLYNYTLTEMPARIEAEGGLAVLAHPSRYSPTIAETVAVGDALWGIEVVSGGTSPAENLKYLDARLSAGKYTCLTAGNDLHAATSGLTTGYQHVSAESAEREELFEAVRACNFFACRADNERTAPVSEPTVRVVDGSIHATMGRSGTIRYVTKNGAVRKTATGTSAEYAPSADDGYVRVEMSVPGAQCYSQPLWLMTP